VALEVPIHDLVDSLELLNFCQG